MPKVKQPAAHQAKDLDMVPLQESDAEASEDGAPKSATAFFALPTPKRKAPEPEPPPAPSGPPPGGMPPVMGPGSMPPMGPGAMPPGMPPMGGIGISGPVAGGQMGGQPGYSMAGGTMAPPPDPEQDRARSYRVFALVAGLMLMVCTALLLMGALMFGAVMMADDKDGAADAANTTPAPAPRPRPRKVVDTGVQDPKPKPTPKPRPSGNPSPRPSPSPAPAPAPPPAPVGPAMATIKIPSSEPFTGVEVTCPISGFRERATFAGGSASIANVPQEDCTVIFKGGPPARNTIRGGQTKSCEFPNGQAVCN